MGLTQVQNGMIADLAVTDAKVNDLAAGKLTGSRNLPKAVMAAGSVLQVVQATKTDTQTTTSTSFVDVTGLTLTITPTSSSSKILIDMRLGGIGNTLNAVKFNILRNGVAIAQPDSGTQKATVNHFPGGGTDVIGDGALWLDSPATTSPITYKVQWMVDGSTGYLNRHTGNVDYNSVSTLTAMEVAA